MLKLFFQRLVLALKTLQISLLLFQRLSELAIPVIEIFHFPVYLNVFLNNFSSQFFDLCVLLLSLCAQTHGQLLHGRDLLLDLNNLSLSLILFNLCLTQFLGHFGRFLLMNGYLFLQ